MIPSRRTHGIAAVVALIALVASNAILTALYTASKHPVDYLTGQTSFDAASIKGWYAAMGDAGTLDLYWATQLFDFVFITAVAATGLITITFLARIQPERSLGQRLAHRSATLLLLGAGFDALENLISFVMLAAPQTFPNWIALPYSSAAVIKFGLIGLALLLLALSVVAWSGGAINRRLCTHFTQPYAA